MRYYKDWGNRKVRAIVVFLVMNLFTCIWNPVTNVLIANEGIRNVVQAIVTKVVTGGAPAGKGCRRRPSDCRGALRRQAAGAGEIPSTDCLGIAIAIFAQVW